MVSSNHCPASTPEIIDTSSTYSVTIPSGKTLIAFAVGGGGGSDDSYSGSSGFFHKYIGTEATVQTSVVVGVSIGAGGLAGGFNGTATNVTVDGKQVMSAAGGGGKGGEGWSGGTNTQQAGSNGKNGSNPLTLPNGNGLSLPGLCQGVTLTPGAAGTAGDGPGAGGVIVGGRKPNRSSIVDGEGFGAGGGEDSRAGVRGVAVIMLCD